MSVMWKFGCGRRKELREIQVGPDEYVTLEELIGATRNFSDKMEIGRGLFGTLYKAELRGGRIVTVKILCHVPKGKTEEQLNEFKSTLKSLRHENLAQLLDAYFGKGLHLFIYEYMPNKSIADALFGSNTRLKLDWGTRVSICLGIARGLEHLHEQARPKIVHRDIGAQNIFLDENLTAKILDFGIASLYTEEELQKIIKGELPNGYMAPEYAIQGFATSEADVYSFGAVIIEIVSGKKNRGYEFNHEGVYLLDMAYAAYENGKLMDLVDNSLCIFSAREAISLLTLARRCMNVSPTLRPRMAEVVTFQRTADY